MKENNNEAFFNVEYDHFATFGGVYVVSYVCKKNANSHTRHHSCVFIHSIFRSMGIAFEEK